MAFVVWINHTAAAIFTKQQCISPPPQQRDPQRLTREQAIAFLRRSLVSIRKEMAAGTLIDPKMVIDLEKQIAGLEKTLARSAAK